MTKATLKRLHVLVEIFPVGFFALAGVVSPRLVYAVQSLNLSQVFRVHVGLMPGGIDFVLALVFICLLPLLVFCCWRASRPIAEARRDRLFATPIGLYLGTFATMLMTAWLPPLVDFFGRMAVLAGFVWWFASLLSVLAFVLAAAQVEGERIGVKSRTLALETLHHLGGAAGVAIARRYFPASETCAELAKKPPTAAIFLAAIVILAVLQEMLG